MGACNGTLFARAGEEWARAHRAAQPVRLGLEEVVHGPLQNSPLAGAA